MTSWLEAKGTPNVPKQPRQPGGLAGHDTAFGAWRVAGGVARGFPLSPGYGGPAVALRAEAGSPAVCLELRNYVEYTLMKTVISATTMARQLGDVLGRIRYRRESFIIERNGVVVARLEPAEPESRGSLRVALDAWRDASEPGADFADALERIGAADMTPGNPWDS